MTNDELCLECMSNLNLDEIDETKQTITSLVSQAESVIMNAVNNQVDLKDYLDDRLFVAAVEALTTQLFYDRTLENNLSLGVQMMIVQLQARYFNNSGGDNHGNAKNGQLFTISF